MACEAGAFEGALDADQDGLRQGRQEAARQGQAGFAPQRPRGAQGPCRGGRLEPGAGADADGLEG